LIAVVGEKKFMKIATDFLAQFPSESFTLRNLGSRLPAYIEKLPGLPAIAHDMARFEWAQVVAFDGPAMPSLTQDDVLDAGPAKLKVELQPYITLLECKYPVDDFALALKKSALRGEASNTPTAMPKARKSSRPRVPRPSRTFIAVHRHENMLYFKRLEPEAYAILKALVAGRTVSGACSAALRDADPSVNWALHIQEWFQSWQSLGWFCRRRAKRARA
jgi:hypothetical protein